jgi:hypothetical protein
MKTEGAFPMTLIQHAITRSGVTSLLDTLRGYLIRYRLALYLFSGAAVVLGVVLNWNWLAAAGLFRIVAVLPCALMMFSCIRHGTSRSSEEAVLQHATVPSQCSAASDPQQWLLPRLDRGTNAQPDLSNPSGNRDLSEASQVR